jgi:phosphatidyl-myo-inositol dimannoside synthase
MRVLLVTNDYPPDPGGIQQYLRGWVQAFPGEVRVLAPRANGSDDGVVRHRRGFMWPTGSVRRWVRRHVDEFGPDVILFGAPHPLAHAGPRLRRETGIPYAVLCHGAEITIPAAFPLARTVVAWPLRRADVVLAVSRFTAARVQRLTGRPVRVVGAGVGDGFAPGPAPKRVTVGCVSRFVPRKGQERVLRAVAALRAEGRDVEAMLVGAGRDERRLRRAADRLGVPTTFEVAVPYAELPALYRRMTVFAMPARSRWFGLEAEGLGLVYLEASASGLPVVAGDSGGAPETVRPGVTGFVTADDRALVGALRFLVDHPAEARVMGEAGAAWVSEHYSWEAVAARYVDAFEEATRGVSPPGGGSTPSV